VRIASPLLALSCISFLYVAAAAAGDQDKNYSSDFSLNPKVQVVQIGVRSYSDGFRVPIWAVMIGDTGPAERAAHKYNVFGPYSLNATVWVRNGDAPTWVRTTYQRPRTADEVADWLENAEAFSYREEGGTELLPVSFGKLSGELLRTVEFIVQYDDTSAKAYLFPGTSREEAEAMAAGLDFLL
jgi:hypothetical protein